MEQLFAKQSADHAKIQWNDAYSSVCRDAFSDGVKKGMLHAFKSHHSDYHNFKAEQRQALIQAGVVRAKVIDFSKI